MKKVLIAKDGEEKYECDCCGDESAKLELYPISPASRHTQQTEKALCLLCASTMAGVWYENLMARSDESFEIIKAISVVGNMILRELVDIKKLLKLKGK